ncbi:hypothetical protein [Arthrobacter sp. HLT1-21]
MEASGRVPMPWQRDALAVACEIDPATGGFWYDTVIWVVLRRAGKTTVSRAKLTHRSLTTVDGRMIYTAQNRLKALKRLRDDIYLPLYRSPLKDKLAKPRWRGGEEAVRFKSGSEIAIDAISDNSGHGDMNHEGHIDEAYAHADNTLEGGIQPTLMTVVGSQLWILSAAGNSKSTYLHDKVEVGRALVQSGRKTRTCYLEYSAPADWDPSDPASVGDTHPGVTHTISLDRVMSLRENSLDLAEWERAWLGWWPKAKAPDRVIPTALWEKAYADEDESLWVGTPFWTVDTDPDREWSAIGMAARSDDPKARCYLECLDRQLGTAWVVKTLVELRSRFGGNLVAVDANGAAKSLRKDLEAESFEVILMAGPQRVDACGGFFDDIIDGRLRILNTDDLNHAAANVAKLKSGGDAFIWGRPKSLADITALYSVTIARWLYMEKSADDYNAGDSVL